MCLCAVKICWYNFLLIVVVAYSRSNILLKVGIKDRGTYFWHIVKSLKGFGEVEHKSTCIFPKTIVNTRVYVMLKLYS